MYVIKTDSGNYLRFNHSYSPYRHSTPYTDDINKAFVEDQLKLVKARATFLNNRTGVIYKSELVEEAGGNKTAKGIPNPVVTVVEVILQEKV